MVEDQKSKKIKTSLSLILSAKLQGPPESNKDMKDYIKRCKQMIQKGAKRRPNKATHLLANPQ